MRWQRANGLIDQYSLRILLGDALVLAFLDVGWMKFDEPIHGRVGTGNPNGFDKPLPGILEQIFAIKKVGVPKDLRKHH